MGRLRVACRTVRPENGPASAEQHRRQYRHFPAPNPEFGIQLRLEPGNRYHRSPLLQVDAVVVSADLPEPVRSVVPTRGTLRSRGAGGGNAVRRGRGENPLGLRGQDAGQLVPGIRHRSRERGSDQRPKRNRQFSGRAETDAAMDVADHRLCRTPAGGAGRGGLERVAQGNAAELDRPLGGSASTVRTGRRRGIDFRVHDPSRHLVRSDLYGPVAGTRIVAEDRDAGMPGSRRGLPRAGGEQERFGAHRPGQGKDRDLLRGIRGESGQRRSDPDLDRRLRVGRLWHRSHHGRSGARRPRFGIRPEIPSSRQESDPGAGSGKLDRIHGRGNGGQFRVPQRVVQRTGARKHDRMARVEEEGKFPGPVQTS